MQQRSPHVDPTKKIIEFSLQSDFVNHLCIDGVHQISLSGTFNHWAQDKLLLKRQEDGVWKIEIPLLPEGKYYYKFLVDDKWWLEDVGNPNREPDGFAGFNSILFV